MSKAPSPLLGYNNNVRHKNKVFHIQTEDSGVKYGHIITHLFADGGRILKSVKTSYAEYLANEKMAEIVREMMKQQHKAMFVALRDGKFDHLLELPAGAPKSAPEAKDKDKDKEAKPADQTVNSAAVSAAAAAAALAKAAETSAAKGREPAKPAAAAPEQAAGERPPRAGATIPASPTAVSASAVANLAPAPLPRDLLAGASADRRSPAAARREEEGPSTQRTPPEELTLDIDALERAAAAAEGTAPFLKASSDLPPPPSNLFREKTATGKYKTIGPAAPPEPEAPRAAVPTDRRYAPTRPASIFGQARPQQGNIFGEDLISDKSLDEVILSYLADDLDPSNEKK